MQSISSGGDLGTLFDVCTITKSTDPSKSPQPDHYVLQGSPSIAKKLSSSGCFATSASQGLQQFETSHKPSFKLKSGVPHVNRTIESTQKEFQANCSIGFLAPLICGIDGVPPAFLSD
jgi:hypothetical protein